MDGEDGSYAAVVVENHGTEPVRLKKDISLCTVVPVKEVTPGHQLCGGEVCGGEVCGREGAVPCYWFQ